MSSSVPKGWREYRQGDVVKLFNGRAYKLAEWEKEGTPVIRLQNLTGSGKDYYYSKLALPSHQYCEYGDLLYMWSATFGPHIWKGPKAIYHYHIWKIECDEVNITKPFLFQLLNQKTNEWMTSSNGMGILHVTKGSMEEMILTLPPFVEQQKIASILTAVDEVIESTQAQINKLKDLKTGMMQELLTKGIGRDGQPHTEFKDSPVGRIPKAWGVTTLGESTARFYQGINTVADKIEYVEAGIPILQAKHITSGQVDLLDAKYVSDEDYLSYSEKFQAQIGDILFTNIGTIGKSAIVVTSSKFLIAWNVFLIRSKEELDSKFLHFYLQYLDYLKFYDDLMTGNATKFVNKSALGSIFLPLPSQTEQIQISSVLSAFDERISNLNSKFVSLRYLKGGLMQALLTGKVRVQ